MVNIIAEVKRLIKEEKLIIGTDRTVKGLEKNTILKVFLASNCPEETVDKINHYSGINGIEVVTVPLKNSELSDVCKKSFNISVLGQIE